MRKTILALCLSFLLSLQSIPAALAASRLSVANNPINLNFPDSATFRATITSDEALLQTYGFDVQGLEQVWRAAIGAQPQPALPRSTARPTPISVPTIAPVGGAVSVLQVTSTPVPTSSSGAQPTGVPARTAPPLSLTLILLGMCCIFLILIGVVVLGFVVRNENRKAGNNG